MTRRAVTPKRVRTILFRQAQAVGAPILCALCGQPIKPLEAVTLEHLVPLAFGGADDDGEDNCRYVHTPCAAKKTQGTDGTGGRGDIAAIAKAKRLANGGKKTRGPKIQSRGFQKHPNLVRGVGGKVRERP